MRNVLTIVAFAAALVAAPALAADLAATGAATGAAGPVIVESPFDAPPQEVQTYILPQPVEAVTIEGPVAVRKRLRHRVAVYPAYRTPAYAPTYVYSEPVVVVPEARPVISIIPR